jgi:hypothetical protein
MTDQEIAVMVSAAVNTAINKHVGVDHSTPPAKRKWFQFFIDLVTDKNGEGDDKRLAGWIFLAAALLSVFWILPGRVDCAAFLAGTGTTLLFGGVLGDKVSPTAGGA